MVRHIRRYANRKNYDMNDSCYTNLDQIAEKVRAGDEVCVTEHLSGRDITAQILAQIISADLADGRSSVTVATLTKVIREGIPAAGGSAAVRAAPREPAVLPNET